MVPVSAESNCFSFKWMSQWSQWSMEVEEAWRKTTPGQMFDCLKTLCLRAGPWTARATGTRNREVAVFQSIRRIRRAQTDWDLLGPRLGPPANRCRVVSRRRLDCTDRRERPDSHHREIRQISAKWKGDDEWTLTR